MKAIEAENLHYTYSDGTAALRGVNLTVENGETLVLLGPNGSGKTTLLLILGCLLHAQKGRLRVCGVEVNDKNIGRVRRKVGVVFQNPDDQVIAPTVYDDVAFGVRNLGYDEEEVERRVSDVLKLLDIYELRQKNPDNLSGGQKKKVAIAGILAMRPEVIIMDEPTSGLDGFGFKSIVEIIEGLRGEHTMIIATHDMDLAETVGERFAYLYKGRIVHESPEIDYSLAAQLGIRCYMRGVEKC